MQIDEGIRLLTEQIQMQQQMNNQERDKWLKQKQQLDTMVNIHDRFDKAEKQIAELREQHNLEEITQRRAGR